MFTEIFIELNSIHLVTVEQILDLPAIIFLVHGITILFTFGLSSFLKAVIFSLPVKREFGVQGVCPYLKVVVVIMAVLSLVPLELLVESQVASFELLSSDWVEIAPS